MIRLLFAFVIIINAISVQAQKDTILFHGWEFLREDVGSVWEVVRYARKGSPQSVPVWEKVTLPHCFNSRDAVDPDENYYQGPGWYRKAVNFDNPYKKGRILLHFDGAGQKTEVFVFTEKAGEHIGGYDEWTVDVTQLVNKFKEEPYLKKYYGGKIPVSIRTDNTRDVEMIPSDLSDFNLYGGLYRNVHLIYVPETYISNIKVTPLLSESLKKGNVNAEFKVEGNIPENSSLKIIVSDDAGRVVLEKNVKVISSVTQVSFDVKKPILWSPDSPYLYNIGVKLTAGNSNYSDNVKIGFRRPEFRDKGPFYLNGKRLLIKGMSLHEDHAGVAAAMTDEQITNTIVLMKKAGTNFVRLAHYQQSNRVLELCDSLGIMVWEEIPWCRGGLGHGEYKDQVRRMLRNLITQHYNHPSVIIWGLGNENDWPGDFMEYNKDSVMNFMTELNALAHELDSTRVTGLRRCDFCKQIVDVYSPSIWAGWYRGKYTEYKKVSRENFEGVEHFIHMEWGASSHAMRHSENPDEGLESIPTGLGADERDGDATLYGGLTRASKDGDWTESYACNLIDWTLKEQETMPWLTGAAYWIFKDFSTPVRPENPIPYMNQKGIVQRDLSPKESFYVFQSYWTSEPMVRIYGHTWPIRWGKPEQQKLLKVYSNCDRAELFLNGKSLGLRHRDSQDFPAAGLRWTTPFKKGMNEVFVKAWKGKTIVTDSVKFYYETREWGEPSIIDANVVKCENGITTVEFVVKDKNGIICLDAKSNIRFSFAGEGEMLDDLGTYGGSRKIQLANGRAEMSVKHGDGQGVLSAVIEGLEPVFIQVGDAQ
ncbi:MAG: glycoside hydrolase family 2 protein [Chlorobi bacterium]|nr:glycoside hydrolase family 2 protein [Chlorobiota bacterium]